MMEIDDTIDHIFENLKDNTIPKKFGIKFQRIINCIANRISFYIPLETRHLIRSLTFMFERLRNKYIIDWERVDSTNPIFIRKILDEINFKSELTQELLAFLPQQCAVIEIGIEGFLLNMTYNENR